MDRSVQELRVEALDQAVRNASRSDMGIHVVERAVAYLHFLETGEMKANGYEFPRDQVARVVTTDESVRVEFVE